MKHNKSKLKKPIKNLKKQSVKKSDIREEEYSLCQRISIPKHEILPKSLRSRKVPGFSPQLQVIHETSNNLSHESNLPSPEIPSEPVQEPYHVDKDTIAKLEQDLNKIKLTLKSIPGSKNWVSYDNIQKFPINEDE